MSDTPRMNKAWYDAPMLKMTQTLYEEGKKLERELNEAKSRIEKLESEREQWRMSSVARELDERLNEANADRLRLREALTQAGAGQFLDTISATPPPPVVAKADADSLAVAMTLDWQAIREALETYRTKYP
jgi:predicted RNase H-like nuclease (RuvC/YqgF family)